MTPTKAWTIELRYRGAEVIAGELHIGALIYSDDVGYDARLTFDGVGICAAHVSEMSTSEDGYIAVAPSNERDEAVRRIVDCDDDVLEALSGYMADYYGDVAYDQERGHCPGCSVCLGVASYAGF